MTTTIERLTTKISALESQYREMIKIVHIHTTELEVEKNEKKRLQREITASRSDLNKLEESMKE